MSNREFEAATEEEALNKAKAALGLASHEEVDYTVVDQGSGGLFGIGARPVKIRVQSDEGEEVGGIVGPAPEKAKKAVEMAKSIAELLGMRADISVDDQHERIVVKINEVEGSTDVAEILGRNRPPAIASFQFLLNKIVNRFPQDRKHILVESDAIQRRFRGDRSIPTEKDPNLDPEMVALGELLAERAAKLKKVITIQPMLPADRRAIHQSIMGREDVKTLSEGDGIQRRLHILPKEMAPAETNYRRGGGHRGHQNRHGHGGGRRHHGGQRRPQGAGNFQNEF